MDTPAQHRETTVTPRPVPWGCAAPLPDHPAGTFPDTHREGDAEALASLPDAQLEGPVTDGGAAGKDGPDHRPAGVQGRLVPEGGGKVAACRERETKVGGQGPWQPSGMVGWGRMESWMDFGGS